MAKTKEPLNLKWRSTHGSITGAQLTRVGNGSTVPDSLRSVARRHFVPRRHTTAQQYLFLKQRTPAIMAWRALDPWQQDAWSQFGVSWPEYDRYGILIELSGWNWFNRLNQRAFMDGKTPLVLPPPDPYPDFASYFSVYFSPLDAAWRVAVSVPPVGDERIYCTRKINQLQTAFYSPFPFLKRQTFFPFDMPDPVIMKLFELRAVPTRHWFSFVCIDVYNRSSNPVNAFFDSN